MTRILVAVVLGPIMEKTLFMAHGKWQLLVFRPLSATLLLIGAIVLIAPAAGVLRRRRAGMAAVGGG